MSQFNARVRNSDCVGVLRNLPDKLTSLDVKQAWSHSSTSLPAMLRFFSKFISFWRLLKDSLIRIIFVHIYEPIAYCKTFYLIQGLYNFSSN